MGRVVVAAGVVAGSLVRRRKVGPQPVDWPGTGLEYGGREERPPGGWADRPTEVPARGWWQIVKRAFAESTTDNVSMLAGGVAFAGFVAIFPALIALVSLYGLVADPSQVAATVESVSSGLPSNVQPLIADQLSSITSGSTGGLTTGLVLATVVALFSASGGVQNLMAAVNIAYDETESRGAVKLRLIALGLTLGAIVFILVAVALVAVAPVLLDYLGPVGRAIGQVVRWVVLVALVVLGLAVVYRIAPDRPAPKFRWVSPGSLVATVLWVVGSVLFSVYVNNFGSYNKTYGTLGGVVVLLLWLYLTSYIVLLGAEINSESEYQTAQDTTRGPARPMGQRGAAKADDAAVRGIDVAPPRAPSR